MLQDNQPPRIRRADDEDTNLPAQANIALAVFHRLNPTVSLFDPEISVRFEKG